MKQRIFVASCFYYCNQYHHLLHAWRLEKSTFAHVVMAIFKGKNDKKNVAKHEKKLKGYKGINKKQMSS
jgi:hypothetical protein